MTGRLPDVTERKIACGNRNTINKHSWWFSLDGVPMSTDKIAIELAKRKAQKIKDSLKTIKE